LLTTSGQMGAHDSASRAISRRPYNLALAPPIHSPFRW
jgi:hypothetical protein